MPTIGGTTLRKSPDQSNGARDVTTTLGGSTVATRGLSAAAAACASFAASSGEWKTALTMVISFDGGGVGGSGLDGEAVGVLLRVLAVPHDAVDQLAGAHHVLRHV